MPGLNHKALAEKRSRKGFGWKPKEGENRIRVLPPTSEYFNEGVELDYLAVRYKVHWFKREGATTEVGLCLREIGETCPACAMWSKYREDADPALKEMAREINPSGQFLMNVLVIDNLQAGIQVWDSNWTCYDGIMEIASNPAWGDILSPSNGIDFIVKKTPGSAHRGGYPQYNVTPLPERTNVMPVLEAIDGWKNILDELEAQKHEAIPKARVEELLSEIGFPDYTGGATATPRPAPSAPAPSTPSPGSPPPSAQNTTPAATPTPQPASPAPQPAEATPTPQPAPADVSGKTTEPTVPESELPNNAPDGAPACFGDYNPDVHPCPTCDFIADCQLEVIGAR